MVFLSGVPKTTPLRGDPELIGPLAFSLTGLLTHCVALAIPSEPFLASLRFALIVGAAPLAAVAVFFLADSAHEPTR